MDRGTHLGLIVSFIILAVVVAFIWGFAGWSVAADQNQPERRLTVNGEAEIKVAPDIAEVTFGVESQAPSATQAQRQNAKIMAAVVDAIKKAGVAREDLQTSGYNLFPVRTSSNVPGREKLVGFRASNQLRVIVRNPESIGSLIDEAVRAGATNVEGISFSIADQSALERQVIEKAIADAQSKAKVMTKAAGASLGRPVLISSALEPTPFAAQMRAMSFADRAEVATPVESGKIRVRASVQMTFEM